MAAYYATLAFQGIEGGTPSLPDAGEHQQRRARSTGRVLRLAAILTAAALVCQTKAGVQVRRKNVDSPDENGLICAL